jgi:methylmalonyl-CoA mutase cobalamin-binding subunit
MDIAINYLVPFLKVDKNTKPKGTVVMATVEGDIHDIGKNLVVLMLKNYGYKVIDLGKDVKKDIIINTAIKEKADIIGLSALMTTTMMRMKDVCQEIRDKKLPFKVIVGGAVVSKSFADEIGVGISVKGGDKWHAEFNYLKSGWGNSGLDKAEGFAASGVYKFSTTASQSFRVGFEFVPNRNDIRYYMKRCAYRVGAYYDQAYYKLDGNNINSMGVTLGMTLPVFRWYNGLTVGVDFGQKASMREGMVRERYAKLAIGFNIHDIWFQKPRYN